MKKFFSLVLVVVLFCNMLIVPITVKADTEEWYDNPYYQQFGEYYLLLFEKYASALDNEVFNNLMQSYFNQFDSVMETHKNENFMGSYLYALKEGGVQIILNEMLSKAGIGISLQEKMRMEAIRYLVNSMYGNAMLLDKTAQYVEDWFSYIDMSCSYVDGVLNDKLIDDLTIACKYFSRDQIKAIAEAFHKGAYISEFAAQGADAVTIFINAIMIYTTEVTLIEHLQKVVAPECPLYEDLAKLKENYIKDACSHFVTKMLSDKMQEKICKAVVNKLTGSKGDLAMIIAEIGIQCLVEKIYQGTLADEQVQAICLNDYAKTLKNNVDAMRLEFMSGLREPSKEKIEEYEFIVSAYVASVRAMLVSIREMESDARQIALIEDCIDSLDKFADYKSYIQVCLNSVKEVMKEAYVLSRIDLLLEKLEGKYFTTTQKPCLNYGVSGHGCSKCSVSNVLQKEWFKKLFGTVSINDFPKHDVNGSRKSNSGKSCFGFTCFAQYFVFTLNGNPVVAERVATGKFKRDFIQANVCPGDVLRINNIHSVLVYSVDDDGVTVVDCNWRRTKVQLNCVVQKHTIPYDHWQMAGGITYVNRVTDFELPQAGEAFTGLSKTYYKYYHYTDGYGNYSVCPYYAKEALKWKTAYREETEWLDTPLTLVRSNYQHVHQGKSCTNAGCIDESWYNGGKYKDEYGIIWYREEIRSIPVAE